MSSSGGVSYQIGHLLDKMQSADKDFRFMAANDLMAELQKDSIKLDDDSERKVVKMLLKLLEDKNGEVQNLAVKCLGPLVSKVKEYQVETIVDTLCNNMVGDKEQLRDISSIALKTVISELPLTTQSLAANVCKTIVGRLSAAIAQQTDVGVQLEALDILCDLLSRFGGLLLGFHPSLLEALYPQLRSPRLAVRKRSILALGHLVVSCDQALYVKVMDMLLDDLAKIEGQGQTDSAATLNTRTYIQAIGAVCRNAGHRFGDHVERVVAIVLRLATREDEEMREHCLQVCESMVYKCGKEVTPHLGSITQLCLDYICYDPNYNYEEDEDEDGDDDEMDCDAGDDCGDDSDDEYSDDDDISWKVRRAAAKCLEAVVSTRHEMIAEFYRTVSPKLISRFKEREENVKSDIFTAYVALLKQSKPPSVSSSSSSAASASAANPIVQDQEMMDLDDASGPIAMLIAQVPSIVKALHKQMKDRSVKTRRGCFHLLTELAHVAPGCLASHVHALLPGVQFSLQDKTSNMKIDALQFVQVMLTTHAGTVFHPHAAVLIPAIINAVADAFYKISSEALLVLESMVRVLRPIPGAGGGKAAAAAAPAFNFAPYAKDIYMCCFGKLKASDIDQEVKERAIGCMGQIVATLGGDLLASELPNCLPIFYERLRNEITRLTAVKALVRIASSDLKIDLRPILEPSLAVLATFLRKNQRALKLSTLTLLNILVCNYSGAIAEASSGKTGSGLGVILNELPPLLNEADLHIAQLTMDLMTSVSKFHPNLVSLGPEVYTLAQSPLLQGGALNAMMSLFQAVASPSRPKYTHNELIQLLVNPVLMPDGAAIHKQGRASIAKCVAALTVGRSGGEAKSIVDSFVHNLNSNPAPHVQTFSLLAIGEIGRHIDLSGDNNVRNVIFHCFNNTSEDIKSAASYALGNVSLGNLNLYLPVVLKEIDAQPKRQYLLLHSLKEIISAQYTSANTLKPFVAPIWDQLFRHCESSEEGTRNVVAECLGKLCLIDPDNLLPKLKMALSSPSALMRTTVVTAMKFTISDQPQTIDPLLRSNIGDFLATLTDSDLNVRRVALVALNSAAHNKPSLVRDLLKDLLPHLYNETQKRKELVREVEMGPFKHEVDDGLDLRKAAFECMYTLLDTCVDRLDVFEFLSHVQDGLKDHYDIKMLTYLMLARVAQLCPGMVLSRLDKLVEPLKLTVTTKVKANSVKQEFEKQDELKRSAMRALAALMTIPGADKHPQLNEFLNQIRTTPDLANLFDSIQKDTSNGGHEAGFYGGAAGGAMSMDLS